ncbi:MAG: hypothetical protein MR266_05260 [Erysipelotrichaceae bacterium]|nr:hypothetical protein [Erysipelotrichaceae bacterium]
MIKERQFDNNSTFFDIGIDENLDNFATLYCVMSETKKKRTDITKLALRYLQQDRTLTNDEIAIAKTIIDDSFYKKVKKYCHCKLCSDDFSREVLTEYSSKLQFWEVCFPTVPYFPGNMMIYLKDRKKSKKENIWELSYGELLELKKVISDLKLNLNTYLFDGNLTGINVLFNQISKSQLCIHGHIELMIKNIDKLNYGCRLLNVRNYDPTVEMLNDSMDDLNGIIKTLEGIRISLKTIDINNALYVLKSYENEMVKLINLGNMLRNRKKEVSSEFELSLLNGMSPAPANSIYLTDYRNELFLSSVPEIIPPTISLTDVGSLEDEENMYLTKFNATTPNSNFSIIRKYSPLVRPSSKVSTNTIYSNNVKELKLSMKRILK